MHVVNVASTLRHVKKTMGVITAAQKVILESSYLSSSVGRVQEKSERGCGAKKWIDSAALITNESTYIHVRT